MAAWRRWSNPPEFEADPGARHVRDRDGSEAQKDQWLGLLLRGEIRPAFLMTEPAVAYSDATASQCSIRRESTSSGGHDLINGRLEIVLENLRVPVDNILLGEGSGFEIAQGRPHSSAPASSTTAGAASARPSARWS